MLRIIHELFLPYVGLQHAQMHHPDTLMQRGLAWLHTILCVEVLPTYRGGGVLPMYGIRGRAPYMGGF